MKKMQLAMTMDGEISGKTQGIDALNSNLKSKFEGFLSTLKPSTRTVYKSAVLQFLLAINSSNALLLKQYNLNMWNQYVADNLKGVAQSTVSNKTYAVKAFFDYLITIGERKSNPLEDFKVESDPNYKPLQKLELSWEQINALKNVQDDKLSELFKWAYYENRKIAETGRNGSYIDYYTKLLGKTIGIENLKYSDITATRKKYFGVCPVTGNELELTEENWTFKDGLLQAK